MSKTANRSRFELKLDLQSGVPVYRQIIDQILAAFPRRPEAGDQLPTVRQLAVDLAINLTRLCARIGNLKF